MYSQDGKEYDAVIDDAQNGYFLVRYVDFGSDCEWLDPSLLKTV